MHKILYHYHYQGRVYSLLGLFSELIDVYKRQSAIRVCFIIEYTHVPNAPISTWLIVHLSLAHLHLSHDNPSYMRTTESRPVQSFLERGRGANLGG